MKGKTEMKKKEQIIKERKVKERRETHLAKRRHEKSGGKGKSYKKR
jgi:hypothetical protein